MLLCPLASGWAGSLEQPGRRPGTEGRKEGRREEQSLHSHGSLPVSSPESGDHPTVSPFQKYPPPLTLLYEGGDRSSDVSPRFLHFSWWFFYTSVTSAFVNKFLTGQEVYKIMLHLTANGILE